MIAFDFISHTLTQHPYACMFSAAVCITSAILCYLSTLVKLRQFPSPRGLPIIGNLLQLNLFSYTDSFDKWHDQMGDTFEVSFLHLKYVDSVEPKVIRQVINSKERDDLYKFSLNDIFGKRSVILSSGPRWTALRKILNPTFSAHALQVMMKGKPEFLEGPASAMVRRLGQVVGSADAQKMDMEFSRVSLAVVGGTIFGKDFGYTDSNVSDPENPFLEELWAGMDEYNKRLMYPTRAYLNPFAMWRFWRTMSVVKGVTRNIVDERIACGNRNSQGQKYTDALSVLLDAKENGVDGVDFTYQDVVDNVLTLLMAGHETTAHTLSFALYEIAEHPEVEQQLVAELDAYGNCPFTYDDLNSGALPYVGKVVQEVLRIHPVAPSIMRAWHRGQDLGDTTSMDDCTVGLTLTKVHFDEHIWKNPHKFDPSRFENEDSHPVTSYLPFGGGPRTCIGKKLALFELKYLLATLYRHFTFKRVPDFEYEFKITITMHEVHGMPMIALPRTRSA